MREKPLVPVTVEDIKWGDIIITYGAAIHLSGNNYRINTTEVFPFSKDVHISRTEAYGIRNPDTNKFILGPQYDEGNKIAITGNMQAKAFDFLNDKMFIYTYAGIDIDIRYAFIQQLLLSYYNGFSNLDPKNKNHMKLKKFMLKHLNPDYLTQLNTIKTMDRINKKDAIQKKYNAVNAVYTSMGTKAEIRLLADIDSLFYCEAEAMLDKIIEKFSKQSTPRNILLYREYCYVVSKAPITCEM